jgi:hypothetical protein
MSSEYDTATHGTVQVRCTCHASPPESHSSTESLSVSRRDGTRHHIGVGSISPRPRTQCRAGTKNRGIKRGGSRSEPCETESRTATTTRRLETASDADPGRGNVRWARKTNAVGGGRGRGPAPA